ncbi:MAG TPA: hypothetical protein VMW78_06185 [Anaerolineae bacterium]|nr:hypothetical protein [Anaerolineae bacterium]
MPTFKTYHPYQVDLDLISKSSLRVMNQEKRLIAENPFLEVLRGILGQDDHYEVEDLSFTLPALVVKSRGEEIRIETQNRDETYLLHLLKLCLEVGKEGWVSEWAWYYIEDDRVIEDPGTAFIHFFICQSGKILRDLVVLHDIPEGLLKEKEDFFFFTDRENQMAETRLYFEDFLQNSRHGQLLFNRLRNKRDIELFGSMSPRVDEFPLGTIMARMNIILKELRWQRWILVVAFIVIAAILLYKL